MSKSIVIDKESYTRTKKKLKKSLEAKGVSFTLSEVSDILAQSFGFKNEFDMHKNYFESLEQISKQEALNIPLTSEQKSLLKLMAEPSESIKMQAGKTADGMSGILSPWSKEPVIFNDVNGNKLDYNPFSQIDTLSKDSHNKSSFDHMALMLKKLDIRKSKGNIVIAGKPGVGVTSLVNMILNSNPGRLETIDHERKLLLQDKGDLRTENDLKDVMLRNKRGANVVFGVHANSKEMAIDRIKSLDPNFDISSIHYLFLMHRSSDNVLEIYAYDMSNEHDKLQVFGMEWKRK